MVARRPASDPPGGYLMSWAIVLRLALRLDRRFERLDPGAGLRLPAGELLDIVLIGQQLLAIAIERLLDLVEFRLGLLHHRVESPLGLVQLRLPMEAVGPIGIVHL